MKKYPFEVYPWNDDIDDKTRWVDAHEAKKAFDSLQKQIEDLKVLLDIERAEAARAHALIRKAKKARK